MVEFAFTKLLVVLFLLLSNTSAALVETYKCTGVSSDEFRVAPFISEAFYHPENTTLNFRLNSKILDTINDVNSTTNRFTTLKVSVDFMGRNIIDDYLRFCDYAILNTNYNNTNQNSSLTDGISNSSSIAQSASQKRSYFNDEANIDPDLNLEVFEEIGKRDIHDSCPLVYGDHFYLNYSVNVGKYHKLGSYSAQFSIISNVEEPQVIGCARLYVTPVLPSYISTIIFATVVCFLIITAIINIFIVIGSSHQESTNPFLFIASTICNGPLLKQMDCTVKDILSYLQFALFIGGLGLQYPGYYQPLISNIRWCALMIYSITSGTKRVTEKDHVYVTYNEGGLKTLALYTIDQSSANSWSSFMVWLLLLSATAIVIQELMVCASYLSFLWKRKNSNSYSNKGAFDFKPMTNIFFLCGFSLNLFLRVFAAPFLILTIFLLHKASEYNGKPMSESSLTSLSIENSHFNATQIFDGPWDTGMGATYYFYTPTWTIVISSLLLALWISLYLFFFAKYIYGSGRKQLYSSLKVILVWGQFYHRYSPGKVPFIIFETIHLFFKCIVIGGIPQHGGVQVILLIVSEMIYFLFFLFVRPNYIDLKWSSSEFLLGVSRISITVLCIPYIISLGINETVRTYVSYVQLCVHAAIGVIFFSKLLKSFVSTVHSIYQSHHDERQYSDKLKANELEHYILSNDPSADIYYRAKSERKLIELRERAILNNSDLYEVGDEETGDMSRPGLSYQYQSRASNQVSIRDHYDPSLITPLATEFGESYEFSNRKEVDYTVREADLFYDRFCENVDPEVKQLWDSRQTGGSRFQYQQATTNMSYSSISKSNAYDLGGKIKKWSRSMLGYKIVSPQVVERGFQVARPRKLVVKDLGAIDNNKSYKSEIASNSSTNFKFYDKSASDDSFNFNPTVIEDEYYNYNGHIAGAAKDFNLSVHGSSYMNIDGSQSKNSGDESDSTSLHKDMDDY